jgi:LAO/AO transport system kinase
LMMRDHDEKSWMIKIIRTIATQNKGIDEIANEIEIHKDYLTSNNLLFKKREQRTINRIKYIVEDKIREELWSESGEISLNSSLEKVVLGKLSPYHIAEKIIEEFKIKRA